MDFLLFSWSKSHRHTIHRKSKAVFINNSILLSFFAYCLLENKEDLYIKKELRIMVAAGGLWLRQTFSFYGRKLLYTFLKL